MDWQKRHNMTQYCSKPYELSVWNIKVELDLIMRQKQI